MGLFAKYCSICGMKIEKGRSVVRFGKHFCSEEHAETYVKQASERTRTASAKEDTGCC